MKQEIKVQVFSFFGPPGSGKGTVAERCVKEFGFEMLSTGNLCRKHMQEQTQLGKLLQKYVDAGHLIPDELITQMVLEWLKERLGGGKRLILDGYPRTKGQAENFLKILKSDKALTLVDFEVIYFDLSEEEVVKRISNRWMCSNKKCQAVYSAIAKKPKIDGICDKCGSKLVKRVDDEEVVVRERLKVFGKYKDDLLIFYKDAGLKVLNFTATTGTTEDVFQAFVKQIINA